MDQVHCTVGSVGWHFGLIYWPPLSQYIAKYQSTLRWYTTDILGERWLSIGQVKVESQLSMSKVSADMSAVTDSTDTKIDWCINQ